SAKMTPCTGAIKSAGGPTSPSAIAAERRRSLTHPRTRPLPLDGVRHLEEQRAVLLDQIVARRDHPVVAVAEKEHGLPVHLVAVEHRAEERAVVLAHREGVARRIALGAHV